MMRLIEDYANALTEEFELRDTVDRHRENIRYVEAKAMVYQISDEPKLPQWKAQEIVRAELHVDEQHYALRKALKNAEAEHGRAKIRLAVAVERLELTKARLYGGHHETYDAVLAAELMENST